jgi:quinol monooxygenase YgiN
MPERDQGYQQSVTAVQVELYGSNGSSVEFKSQPYEEARLTMIIAALYLVPRADKRQAMLEILRSVEDRVRTKAECLGGGVFEAADGTSRVLYEEHWQSAKDLHAHIQSGLYLRVLNAMELASEQPKVCFHEVSHTNSLKLVEELRSNHAAN